MAGYMSKPWGYCERSGAKVPLHRLRKDGDKGIWCDSDWADPPHPLRFPRIIGPDHMHVEPVTSGEAAETWTSFIGPLTLSSTATGYARSTVRVVIAAGTGSTSLTWLRIKFTAPSSSRVLIGSAWVGTGGLATPYAFSATPTQLRVNTSESFAIDAGSTVSTDRISTTMTGSSAIVVSFDLISDVVSIGTPSSAYTTYSKSATQEARLVAATGYSANATTVALVSAIEVV